MPSRLSLRAPEESATDSQPNPPLIATVPVGECNVCGDASRTKHAVGYDYELRTCSNEWVFVHCDVCGHVWLDPRPAPETLGVIYPPHYYAYDYEHRVSSIARRGKAMLDARKLKTILRRFGRTPRTYLDIGCGSGQYLDAMAARGVPRNSIHGLELDETVVRRLSAAGYTALRGRVEDVELASESLDLVTIFHVLEHVSDPAATLRRVGEWLAPGGVVAIETPNIDSVDHRLFARSYWGGYHIPRHWHLFSPRTLRRSIEGAGLEPIHISYQTGHSFWMYSVHHALLYGRRPHPRLAELFDPLRSVVLLAAFTGFDKLRAALGARTSAMLMLARRPGV